jgi:hypothetical protein
MAYKIAISVILALSLTTVPHLGVLRIDAVANMANDGDSTEEIIKSINQELQQSGVNIALAEIEYYTIGKGRPSDRILQVEYRWVPGDERRMADGKDITYLVNLSRGSTSSGLDSGQTERAIDRAMETLGEDRCIERNVEIIKRPDSGKDPDILDGLFGFGGIGDPFVADIVNAGWLPLEFFKSVAGEDGDRILAFAAIFVFVDEQTGIPTDINGDNYADTAAVEVYYNDSFGNIATDNADRPWGIDIPLPGIDVETVALHENGHSVGLGHFGPPPQTVMNPRYSGIQHELSGVDSAGLCTVWSSWPRR